VRHTAGTAIFDLDGVLYLGSHGIPGAAASLRTLEEGGWSIVFATNNSTKTPEVAAQHIFASTGYRASPSQAVTSTMAAVSYARGRHASAFVVGPPSLTDSLARAGITLVTDPDEHPDAVIVGLDRSITYDAIDRAGRAIRAGSEFIATNIDPTYPTPSGLSPGAGALVAAIAAASGCTPISCGKPGEVFSSLLTAKLGDGPVWVIGDRLDTDIALASANGWQSILVLTGVTKDADLIGQEYAPDVVVASIVDVPQVINTTPARPAR